MSGRCAPAVPRWFTRLSYLVHHEIDIGVKRRELARWNRAILAIGRAYGRVTWADRGDLPELIGAAEARIDRAVEALAMSCGI